jgi:hypothetical protein
MNASRLLYSRYMALLLTALLVVTNLLPGFAAERVRAHVDRVACEAKGACTGRDSLAGLLLLVASKQGGQGHASATAPASSGPYSPLDAPSTEVYNPDPAGFLFDGPAVYLDSSYQALDYTDVELPLTGIVENDTAALQSAIDDYETSAFHVRILLPDNFVSDAVRVPNNLLGDYCLVVEWSGIDAVQAEGVQADWTTVATTHANAPIIRSNDGFGQPAVRCDLSAHHVRFVGIHFKAEVQAQACFNLLQIAGSVGSDDFSVVTDVTKCPRWIVVDRCWVDGGNVSNVRNGIQNDAREFCCVDSVIAGGYVTGNESHGIVTMNGPGPHKYVGCAIEGGSIGYLIGGVDPLIVGLQTSDIEFRRCYQFKRPSWNKNGPTWDGTSKTCKNLFELKWGSRLLVEGNVFDGNYHDGGQQGSYLVWKTENSNGGNVTATTHDITFRYNLAKNVSGGHEFIGIGDMTGGGPPALPLYRVHHFSNLAYEMGTYAEWDANSGSFQGSRAMVIDNAAQDIVVDHDTLVLSATIATTYSKAPIIFSNGGSGPITCTIRNSIVAWLNPTNESGYIIGDGSLTDPGPGHGTSILDLYCPDGGWVFEDNLLANTYSPALYPSASEYPTTHAAIGFASVAGLDFRLDALSTYKGMCADGSDPGANVDLVELATAGVAP